MRDASRIDYAIQMISNVEPNVECSFFFRCIKWEKKRDNERIQKKKVTKSRCSLVNVVSLYISMYRWRICPAWEACSRTIAQTSSVISIIEGASLTEGVIRLTMSRKRWCARKSRRFATTWPVSSFDGTRRFLFEWQVDRSLFPKTLDEQRSLLIRVNAILAANIELAALRESDQTSFSIEPTKNHRYGRSSSHCQRNCYVPAWKPATWSTRSHFFLSRPRTFNLNVSGCRSGENQFSI